MILNEDENSITYETPQGPLRVAKSGVSPDFMGQFSKAATVSPEPQVSPQTIAGTNEPPAYEELIYDPMMGYQVQATTAPESPPPPEMPVSSSGDGLEAGQLTQNEVAETPSMSAPSAPATSSGMNRLERGLTKEANLAEEQGKQTAAYYDGMAKQMEQQARDRQYREEQKELAANQHYEEMRQSQEQLSKMKPQDFWADKSTGSRVIAGLSVMLGALGGAMDGTGANQGADVIDKAIERDLKMQMMNRDIAKEGIEGKKSLFQMRMNQYKDKDMAEAAARSDMLQGVELQIKKMQASNAGPQAKAKLDQVLGEIQMKKEAANAELASKFAEAQQKNLSKFVPALGGYALSDEGAKQLKTMGATVDQTRRSVNDLLSMADTKNKRLSPDMAARAQVIKGTLMGSLRTFLVGPGAVSEYEQKLLDSIVADPTKMFSLDSKNKTALKELINKVDYAYKAMAKQEGFAPQESKQIKTTARK
jgi:hypothetical protein